MDLKVNAVVQGVFKTALKDTVFYFKKSIRFKYSRTDTSGLTENNIYIYTLPRSLVEQASTSVCRVAGYPI